MPEKRIRNEMLASRLYALAGVDVPEISIVEMDGKKRLASKLVDSTGKHLYDIKMEGTDAQKSAFYKDIQEDFAADVWLGNYDVLGIGNAYPKHYPGQNVGDDNIMEGSDGKPVRVDTGASLLFTGSGNRKSDSSTLKAFGDVPQEWDFLPDSLQGKDVYLSMTDKDMAASAERIAQIDIDEVNDLVDSIITDKDDAAEIKAKLAKLS